VSAMTRFARINRRQFLAGSLLGATVLATDILGKTSIVEATSMLAFPPLPYAQNALEPHLSAKTVIWKVQANLTGRQFYSTPRKHGTIIFTGIA